MRREIEIRIEWTPRWTGRVLLLFLLLALPRMASPGSPQDSTLTSYYPPSTGIFKTFSTTQQTELATHEGNLILLGPNNPLGRVGVGTTNPQSRLHVAGWMEVSGSNSCITLKGVEKCCWSGCSKPIDPL